MEIAILVDDGLLAKAYILICILSAHLNSCEDNSFNRECVHVTVNQRSYTNNVMHDIVARAGMVPSISKGGYCTNTAAY